MPSNKKSKTYNFEDFKKVPLTEIFGGRGMMSQLSPRRLLLDVLFPERDYFKGPESASQIIYEYDGIKYVIKRGDTCVSVCGMYAHKRKPIHDNRYAFDEIEDSAREVLSEKINKALLGHLPW